MWFQYLNLGMIWYFPITGLFLYYLYLSKILGRFMYNRLILYINRHGLLYEYQFGFQKGKSTHMALITLIDKITEALDQGELVIGIFLDFSKAFDTVDHGILHQKRELFGVQDNALKWFDNYLSNRLQYVTYNNVKSDKENVKCGVPQGSILDPLLFLLYITWPQWRQPACLFFLLMTQTYFCQAKMYNLCLWH